MSDEQDTLMPFVTLLIDTIKEIQNLGAGVALLQEENGKFCVVISSSTPGVLVEANKAEEMPEFIEQFQEWKEEE